LQCGEGGAILLNDSHFIKKVQNILEKGTNRNEFVIGNVKRYEWVEVGSSFLMTELHAAYLYAQLEKAQWIKQKRYTLWNLYYNSLKILEDKRFLSLPRIPDYAEHNAHTFYIILDSNERLTELKSYMEDCDIQTAVHYSSLDLSPFWKRHQKLVSKNLESLRFNNCLLRLPLYNSMTFEQVEYVTSSLLRYFNI
jgi:dTDP-4-amino-4,6-dideoxygalactose transaminase